MVMLLDWAVTWLEGSTAVMVGSISNPTVVGTVTFNWVATIVPVMVVVLPSTVVVELLSVFRRRGAVSSVCPCGSSR